MSQVTDSMCKYAHNSYFNNWSGDNASNKITCSLWDTLCILESLFWTFKFFFWTQSKFGFRTFFLTKCRKKTKSLFFEEKLSPGVLDLVNYFSVFRKDALRLWSNIFETFRFAPRKRSLWKNLFVFQGLMFLYQLVNLVLETCLIFSKTLKLGKTFLSWVFSSSSIIRTTSVMILLFQIIFRNSFQERIISWVFGVFTKSIVVSILDFDTSLSERCLSCWLVKGNHNWPWLINLKLTVWLSGVVFNYESTMA